MLTNPNPLRPSWLAFGWFIAAAITSLVLLALTTFEVVGPESPGETLWTGFALLVGFGLAGFIAGWRSGVAPIWFGVAMAVLSMAVGVVLNLVAGDADGASWEALPLPTLALLALLQIGAASFGALFGLSWALTPDTDQAG